MRWQKGLFGIAVIVLGVGWFAEREATGLKRAPDPVPTASVRLGPLRLDVRATGDLETRQIVTLVAPPADGETLQIVRLDPTGTVVKSGDIVLQFDPSEQRYERQENQSVVEEAEQEIAQAKAQAAVQNSDDRLALLKAQYAVRQAELEDQENPILAAIDAKKNLLALAQAKSSLAQAQQDLKSDAASNQAALALAEAKYEKAQVMMRRAERNIRNMTIRSPIAGVVKVEENRMAAGGFFYSGMTLPEFHPGDQAQPGTPILQILDINHMIVEAHVAEMDRPLIHLGERVEIRVDAMPGQVFEGTVTSISGMATRPVFSANPTRRFDVTIGLTRGAPGLRPGFTVHLTLLGERIADALYIPRIAVFGDAKNAYVYVRKGGKFRRVAVQLRYETAAWAVVDGLAKGDRVALMNPSRSSAAGPRRSPAGAIP